MSQLVPPSLAFYIRHPKDNEALSELETRLEGVSDADWQKYKEVMGRASEQVGALVTKWRDVGLEVLGKRVEVTSRSRSKYAVDNWNAWAEVWISRTGRKRLKIWMGAFIGSDPSEAVWAGPYVSMAGGTTKVRALGRILNELMVANIPGGTDWYGEDSVPLELIQLRVDSDLDAISGSIRAAFERLLPALPKLAMIDL